MKSAKKVLANKRVLITGSQGFTGRYVYQEFFNAGWNVWGAGPQPKSDVPNFLPLDLHDQRSLAAIGEFCKPDVVVHLAANAYVGGSDPADFYHTNTLGTRNLLEAIDQSSHTPERVILASSANIYGNRTAGKVAESTLPDPRNDYAVSKLAMEYVARLWSEKLPIIITRPFNYTGIGQSDRFLIPKIVAHFKSRSSVIELGNIDVSRDFSDVRDIARYYLALAEHGPIGETVNFCSGRPSSLTEVIEIATEISGHEIQVEVNPAYIRQNEVHALWGDRDKLDGLVNLLEIRPIKETLQWMLTGS